MNVTLYGAASNTIDRVYIDRVEELGLELAKAGHTMVFGGGSSGLMGAAARGMQKGNGHIIGVVPHFIHEFEPVFDACTELIHTETMAERKDEMESRADAFIIVPGGIGTFDELFEILTLRQLGRHSKPVVLFNLRGYFDPLLAMLDKAIEDGFMKEECRTLWAAFTDANALLDYLEQYKGEIGFFKEVDHDQSV